MRPIDVVWKNLTWPLGYAAAKRRTARDVAGTAYWLRNGTKHLLWIKIGDDRWLCFGGRTLDVCLDDFARMPGKGGRSDDHLIANGITTNPREKAPTVRTTVLVSSKPPRRPRALNARLTADEIWRELEARGAQVLRRAVNAKELAAAEKTLGFRFPSSYRALVKAGGVPAIARGKRSRAEDMEFAVLTPKEVVRFTKSMRRLDADMFEDDASLPRVKAQLANAVLFQLGRDAGEGYVFLLDTAGANGEFRIADYSHDYIEELDWRPSSKVVFRSLAASTLHAATQIAEDLHR